ncbi:MAG: packaged DNA stabilization protein [Bryobacteraceae bacterium]
MDFGFVGPTYQSRSLRLNAQRTINLYPEIDESGSGKAAKALYGTPGLTIFSSLPTAPVRCLWAGEERLFAVAGSKLYEVFSDGSFTQRGEVGDDDDHTPAQIFPNGVGTQILVVSAGLAYCDGGSGPVKCTFTGGGDVLALTGCYLDGYGIVHAPYSKQFYYSGLNDFNSWDPLDVQSQEAYPDNIYAILADHRELWTFGNETIEVYRNEGDADIVFRTDPSAFIDMGIAAGWSVVKLPSMGPAWLAGDSRGGVVAYKVSGFSPVRVSTHAVETAWSKYSKWSDALGYVYTEQGHTFWVITFPTGNATWAYDVTSGMWHERAYGSGLDRHRGRCHAFTFSKHFVGDHTDGTIYEQSVEHYDDAGTAITRLRTAPHVHAEEARVFHSRLQLDVEVGEISNPQFALEVSNNGGKTFGTAKTRTAGAIDAYTSRVIWHRLGSTRDRVYRVSSTAAMRHAWVAAYLKATPGEH